MDEYFGELDEMDEGEDLCEGCEQPLDECCCEPEINDDFPMYLEYNDDDPRDYDLSYMEDFGDY